MKYFYTSIFIFTLFLSMNAQTCKDLPANFKSYTEALSKVKSASFLVKESVDCNRSFWIHSASYYSCDGETGYLIMKTKEGREYLHKDMPIGVWRSFKNTDLFGGYYRKHINGLYVLKILN
jgi:hypothetical protein